MLYAIFFLANALKNDIKCLSRVQIPLPIAKHAFQNLPYFCHNFLKEKKHAELNKPTSQFFFKGLSCKCDYLRSSKLSHFQKLRKSSKILPLDAKYVLTLAAVVKHGGKTAFLNS